MIRDAGPASIPSSSTSATQSTTVMPAIDPLRSSNDVLPDSVVPDPRPRPSRRTRSFSMASTTSSSSETFAENRPLPTLVVALKRRSSTRSIGTGAQGPIRLGSIRIE